MTLRWCSTTATPPSFAVASSADSQFVSGRSPNSRAAIYCGSAAPPPGAPGRTPKQEELIERWRSTPNNSESDVIEKYGATFKDTRERDPAETDEDCRRRLIYQSRYRGMVEMDLICGHFARVHLPSLDPALLREYDLLLQQLDNDLFNWLVMDLEAPAEISRLKCFAVVKMFVEKERHELLSSI